MKNLQWAWRTVIYNCRKLIVIPPQPFIWSRLVKVQTVAGVTRHRMLWASQAASVIVERRRETALADLLQGWMLHMYFGIWTRQ